ncbi:FliM/FliN family flagellar motor C-terminal domain-containing protein [Paludibacterium paludis]|uniref:Flagellar motor switch protein FliN-like C-terminal domain-containing protein n=1 Tax=Paludibacterium paludis TaxID=1225769 RepID=A0A918U7I2_9NEIS|nr:FliM/FliN family flagellar motor C-terminal domain-containing protein [Paludibacterium paludis]GGY04580.1 hypothetical protein GCM10011289_03870 [Paludibacterium paludis]
MPKSKLIAPHEGRRLDALDPRTLGRPFHLLPAFTQALQDDVDLFLGQRLNRRYHARFAMRGASCGRPSESMSRLSMQRYTHERGLIDVAIDRILLLRLLDYRYGNGWSEETPAADPETVPATETEQRLMAHLGADIAGVCLGTLARLTGQALPATPPVRSGQPGIQTDQAFEIVITLADDGRQCEGRVTVRLDDGLFDLLMRALADNRPVKAARDNAPAFALDEEIRVRLSVSLLSLDMPLGDVLDLKVGHIVPAQMRNRADVHVGKSRLFTASVADNAGKLCLTAFDDVE